MWHSEKLNLKNVIRRMKEIRGRIYGQSGEQEIIFPVPFIYPIHKISIE
jgi:hypothetical protein